MSSVWGAIFDWLSENPSNQSGSSIIKARKLTNESPCYSCRCSSFTKISVGYMKFFQTGCEFYTTCGTTSLLASFLDWKSTKSMNICKCILFRSFSCYYHVYFKLQSILWSRKLNWPCAVVVQTIYIIHSYEEINLSSAKSFRFKINYCFFTKILEFWIYVIFVRCWGYTRFVWPLQAVLTDGIFWLLNAVACVTFNKQT